MSRSLSIVAVLLSSAGVAYGDARGEVRSYYKELIHPATLVATLTDKYVLTDIVIAITIPPPDSENFTLRVGSATASLAYPRLKFNFDATDRGQKSLHFRSGMEFSADDEIHFSGPESFKVTLMGYIPCSDPCGGRAIPAVSNLGLGVLVVLVLAGGAAVINRRQRQAA